jgi:hypothetical protein
MFDVGRSTFDVHAAGAALVLGVLTLEIPTPCGLQIRDTAE